MMIDRRMIRLTAGVRGRIAVKVGLGLGLLTAGVASGIASAEVLARILAGEELDAVLPLLALVGALIGVQAAGRWFQELLAIWIATGVKLRLRLRLYQRLLDLGPGYLARTQTGKVLASVVDGVEHLEGYLGLYIPQAFIAFVGPLAIVIYLMTIDPYVGLIVLISVLVGLFGAQFFERALGEYGQEHWNAYRDLNAEFMDTMQGLPTLKAYNAGKRHGLRLHERAQALYRATIKQMSISLLGTGVTQFATGAGTALATGVAAIQFTRGELTATELFIVLFLSAQCFLPLFEFNQYWHQGFLGLSALAGISELLETKPEVRDQPLRGPTQPQPEGPPAIELEQVTFSYRDGSRPALRDVSLRVEPGRKTAIVGRSGSGKTTVVALLARFFDPQAGAIQIDGRDLREIPLEQLREMIAVVAQDTYLFYGTLADNLRMARPQATLAELEAAARLANAHAFIMATPDGYETLIGERGLTLSGGQRQRIAIARAILKDAPILLLDEATASVDAANEKLIQDALDGLARDRTTLIVAHRLSTIANADQIIVLDEGALVESGRHAELLRRQGAYSRLIAAQRGKGR